jgi:Ca2+-transporting ATPase
MLHSRFCTKKVFLMHKMHKNSSSMRAIIETAPPGEASEKHTEYYYMEIEDVRAALSADLAKGLDSDDARQRLQRFGPNELREQRGPGLLQMFLRQFVEPLVLVLIVAAIVSSVLGEIAEGLVIMAIVLLNAILGVTQESKAEKALLALKKLAAPHARIRRDGNTLTIPASELVPGDLVLIEEGDQIPADIRVVESVALKVDESALTGESVPVEKHAATIPQTVDEDIPLGDRSNILHMATVCVHGRGKGIAFATGMNTEVGHIAGLLGASAEKRTPLQERLEDLGKWLGGAALGLCGIMFVTGLFRGINTFEMFLTAVSLAVSAIPEGLPAIVTVVLAIGVQRMARHKAIIRRLPAVETLGSATAICSDKTGTLTQNEMTVVKAYVNKSLLQVTGRGYSPEGELLTEETENPGSGGKVLDVLDPHLGMLVKIGALCNNSELRKSPESGEWFIVGDPTEGALVVAARKAGFSEDEEIDVPRIGEIPFDSVRKRMTTIHRFPDGNVLALVKGAPDSVLARCEFVLEDGTIRPLDQVGQDKIMQVNADLASQALRVLACAYRVLGTTSGEPNADEVEQGLVFVGLMGMMDPPRPEAAEAISTCRGAGITPIMITGDHKDTALAISRAIGLSSGDGSKSGPDPVLTGKELESMSPEELNEAVKRVAVYARVSPEHKVRIVDALRSQGHVVAMTGDGVNDAPALKRADIGCAMGITGTDVAKGAADMVLADDNFATIVEAVKQGRTIFDNIRKAIAYLLSCNIGEIIAVFTGIALGGARILTPIQILWVNLVTDSLPALALGVEPPEPGTMKRPPRSRHESVFGQGGAARVGIYGLFIAGITLFAFWLGMKTHAAMGAGRDMLLTARTMAFATMSLSQLFHGFNLRSGTRSLFRLGLATNPYMVLAWAVSTALQIMVLIIPGLRFVFDVVPLTLDEWGYVGFLSVSPIILGEIIKAFVRIR